MSRREVFPAQDVVGLLTDKQWKKLAEYNYYDGKSIKDIISQMKAIWDGNHEQMVTLEGMLPCGLYGCMLPDGSTHT